MLGKTSGPPGGTRTVGGIFSDIRLRLTLCSFRQSLLNKATSPSQSTRLVQPPLDKVFFGFGISSENYALIHPLLLELTNAIQKEWGGKPFTDLQKGWKYILDQYPEVSRLSSPL